MDFQLVVFSKATVFWYCFDQEEKQSCGVKLDIVLQPKERTGLLLLPVVRRNVPLLPWGFSVCI